MANKICDEKKVKIFILFLLDRLNCRLSGETLTEIILWDGTINYFVYCDCLRALANGGLVDAQGEEYNEAYSITPLGKSVLEEVESDVLEDAKKKLLVSAARLLAFNSRGSRVESSVKTLDSGGYELSCAIHDDRYSLFELKLYLDNRGEAENMSNRFDEKAESIYRGVLALLTGDTKLVNF
ncbi:MAG: DUF4364 family protein [Oscillospiraceae bacterium]|nr:DUF4364 family protein [Oscillospiraceae bacterium]